MTEGGVGRVARTPTSADPPTAADALPIGEPRSAAALGDGRAGERGAAWSDGDPGRRADARPATLIEADAGSIPMPVRIPHPERVGADRLLGAWTARELYGAPVIVVDLGTATTIDVVDADGCVRGRRHPARARRSPSARWPADTAQLPTVAASSCPAHAIGRDTVEAIQTGVVLGHSWPPSGPRWRA